MSKAKYSVAFVEPSEVDSQRFREAVEETFRYIVNLFDNKEKLALCVVCGRLFKSPMPQAKVCSRKCRIYYTATLKRLRHGKPSHFTLRLRQTLLYLFLWLAVLHGRLSPEILGVSDPAFLPPPLPPKALATIFGSHSDFLQSDFLQKWLALFDRLSSESKGGREK